jgi:hypothetical protein
MNLLLFAAAAWVAVVATLLTVLWVAGSAECRRGAHHWEWVGGQWVCARCSRPDHHAHGVTR